MKYNWPYQFLLSLSIILISLTSVKTQGNSSSISELRRILFPENRAEEYKTRFYGCINSHDSLILNVRKIQPNIPEAIEAIKKIALLQSRSDLPELNEVAKLQIKLFKDEWACGMRQFPICNFVKEQLRLLRALETCVITFNLDSVYQTPELKLTYWRKVSDLFYLQMYKGNPRFEKYLDQNAVAYLGSLQERDITKLRDQLIWPHAYIKEIDEEKNAFGGIDLDWSFITPFIQEIKPFYQDGYYKFKQKQPNNSLEYILEKDFYEQFTNKKDFNKLISK